MLKIFTYTLYDLLRSRWSLLYFGFYLMFCGALLLISGDLSKVIISSMNVVLILCPLIATLFGAMYFYNSREFILLLLAQPVKRQQIFLGLYLGVALSLSLSLVLGLGLPFLFYGITVSGEIWNFFSLILNGCILSFIFSGLAILIALRYEHKIKGFGLAILMWLFFAVIYDGLFLLLLMAFKDYPLESTALGLSLFNPIDLSRILILLQLDISALMGYTGAVFEKFLGTGIGMLSAGLMLGLWVIIPAWAIKRLSLRKDF